VLRVVYRPRLEAAEKTLTEQQLPLAEATLAFTFEVMLSEDDKNIATKARLDCGSHIP